MLSRHDLIHHMVELERTVKVLQGHIRKLEVEVSTVRGEQTTGLTWWRSMWRRGGGGRRGPSPRRVRENKRRDTHGSNQQPHRFCA